MDLQHILTHLIALADRTRTKAVEIGLLEHYSHEGWVGEFCTLRLGGTRQMGHSTAIKETLGLFGNCLLVAPYIAQLDQYKDAFPNDAVVGPSRVSAESIKRGGGLCGHGPYDAVFVDCASYIERDKRFTGVLEQLPGVIKPTGWLILIG